MAETETVWTDEQHTMGWCHIQDYLAGLSDAHIAELLFDYVAVRHPVRTPIYDVVMEAIGRLKGTR
jgi:hypothetical protein